MMKKVLLILLAVIATTSVFAASPKEVDVTIEQIMYHINLNTGFAIISDADESITKANILASVQYEDTDYPVTSVGDYAFYACQSLTNITIPNSVLTIGEGAFWNCYSLESVVIPNSVTTIKRDVFSYCHSLASIIIPNSVTSIGMFAFDSCTNLTDIILPNSITTLNTGLFRNCINLTAIAIPSSVTTIASGAFYGCSGLTDVVIPNGVTSIDNDAFRDCSGLTNITIPNSVTSIGSNAFIGCTSLAIVTIGSTVTKIGEYTFSNCSNLETIYCYAVTPPSTKTSFKDSYQQNMTLHVPEGTKTLYAAATEWKDFGILIDDLPNAANGIENVITNDAFPKTYYRLDGVKVADSADGLTPGIYVVRQGNKSYKISIQ